MSTATWVLVTALGVMAVGVSAGSWLFKKLRYGIQRLSETLNRQLKIHAQIVEAKQ